MSEIPACWSKETNYSGCNCQINGDALKFMLPNYIRKYVCGWTNYSGTEITHKIHENEMGNRVSKSNPQNSVLVKEQRVDGNYHNNVVKVYSNGLSKDWHQSWILSNLFVFSNSAKTNIVKGPKFYNSYAINNQTISPWFVTGFTDACFWSEIKKEGCFMVKMSKSKFGLGWRVQLDFTIGIHVKDLCLLKTIKDFFGVGSIRITSDTCYYSVKSLDLILNTIIPHFQNFPLCTQKNGDFLLFKQVALLMKDKVHLNAEGLKHIINIRASINWGLTKTLNESFPNVVPVDRPVIDSLNPLNPNWFAGFTSCFHQRWKRRGLFC